MKYGPNRPGGLYVPREVIDKAIRQAHRIGPLWEPHTMPLRAAPLRIRKRGKK